MNQTLAKALIALHSIHFRAFSDEQLRDERLITLSRKAALLRRAGTSAVVALADVLLDAVNLECERRKEARSGERGADTIGLAALDAYRMYLGLMRLEEMPDEAQRVEDLRKRAHAMGDGPRVAECVDRARAITEEILSRHQAA